MAATRRRRGSLRARVSQGGKKIGRMRNQGTRPVLHQPLGSEALVHHPGKQKRISRNVGNHKVPQKQQLFCEGRPLLKKDRKHCGRQLLLNMREATLALPARGNSCFSCEGDPTLILREATPAARGAHDSADNLVCFFFMRPVGRPISRLPNGSHDGGGRNLRVRARKF